MERVKELKRFPAAGWPIVQKVTMAIMGLYMLWVFKRSGWNLSIIYFMFVAGSGCWSFYRRAQRQTQAATTDKERLDANWPLLELSLVVVSLLGLSLFLLNQR